MDTPAAPGIDGIRQFLEYVVRNLIGEKIPCRVEHRESGGQHFFALHVPEDERALIIGHAGSTVIAIRNLAAAAGTRQGLRVAVDVPD